MDKNTNLNTKTYTPIASLRLGETYKQIFYISNVQETSLFYKVTLKDLSGEITGIIWGACEPKVTAGMFAEMTLYIKEFQAELSFQVNYQKVFIQNVPPYNEHDYIRTFSKNSLVSYANEIEETTVNIHDLVYRNILCNAIHKLDLLSTLKESPYGLDGPMACRGGLLQHAVHSLRFSAAVCQQATTLGMQFNTSLVVAGCILRNIGWSTTTVFENNILRPRDAHFMTGIYRASMRYIDHLILTCESDLELVIPESKKQALENICNEEENILTLEGKIVACANNMANIININLITPQHQGNWIDNKLFIGHL